MYVHTGYLYLFQDHCCFWSHTGFHRIKFAWNDVVAVEKDTLRTICVTLRTGRRAYFLSMHRRNTLFLALRNQR
jgi:hypothetical protein